MLPAPSSSSSASASAASEGSGVGTRAEQAAQAGSMAKVVAETAFSAYLAALKVLAVGGREQRAMRRDPRSLPLSPRLLSAP